MSYIFGSEGFLLGRDDSNEGVFDCSTEARHNIKWDRTEKEP